MLKHWLVAGILIGMTLPASATVLRIGQAQSAHSIAGKTTARFARLIERYSNGDITVDVYPSSELGGDRSLLASVRTGALDMIVGTFPLLADIVPEYNVYNAGFFYDSWPQLERVMNAPTLGRTWNHELLKRAGLRVLGAFYYGARNLTTSHQPVKTPADVAGLKIRSVPNEMSVAVIRGLGGHPTPVAFADLFQALSQGVVDGQENPLPTIEAQHIYEVQHELILTRHQFIALAWVANEADFQNLSAANRHAIRRAAHEAESWGTQATRQSERELATKLAAQGMDVIGPDDGLDRDAFKPSVRRVVKNTFEGRVWPKGLTQRVLDVAHGRGSDE